MKHNNSEDTYGTISSLVEEKGYGFIQINGFQKDVFFHAKDCQGIRFEQLRKGDKVSIGEILQKDRGNCARNVSLA